jgi:mitogen-activated protein kinase kinase kinase
VVGYIDARYEAAENTLFIFLEYVPGGSIASMLERFGCFHIGLVRKYTRQLLQVG